ncbi:MAG: hypothetical protein QOH21_327, partial [Acidobacteriota bacterium]|nr:hypothetical protein [Acidobacteriota bacterium]
AAALFALASEEPFRINPRTQVSAMLWGALAEQREGFMDAAKQHLVAARRFAWAIPDPSLRATAVHDLTFAEASVLRQENPARAAAILDRYLVTSGQRGRTFLLADACLERARAARSMGAVREAERFYRQALANVAERRQDSLAVGIAEAYFATATKATSELADILESGGRTNDAFGVLETGRGNEMARLETIRETLRDSARLVSYLLLDDRLVIFTVGRGDGPQTTRVAVGANEVRRTIDDFRAAIERRDDTAAGVIAEQLHGWLIAPLAGELAGADTLIVVPDLAMDSLPFGALREPHGGSWLIDRFAIVRAPSAMAFVRSARQAATTDGGLMIYGNPAFVRTRFASLQPLPGAEREAREVAGFYRGAAAVVGAPATASRFLHELPSARMIHLGAHAIASRHEPMRSMLLLAPDEAVPSGIVYASDVAGSICRAQVVVLAGCRTAAPAESPANIRSLGLAFLAAGARNVVGTLWNVDDGDAEAFSQRLHPALIAGVPPAEAVRRVQRELLRTRSLRAWSAFTLTGSGL